MKADILSPKALFQKDIRYVIPLFQRPYVWNQEEQWEPLWNDVRNKAEDYLEELDRGRSEAVGEANVVGHFLGAVVLQQQLNATGELETRQVIDGQQRLTTIQLILDAAQDVFEADGYAKEARLLRKLVLNDADYGEDDADLLFKVWPTLGDQDGFRHAMHNDLEIDGFEGLAIVQAHEFFKLQVRQWLEVPEEARQQLRAHALATALMGLLRLVVIDLEPKDDANVIFETLNARGTPLLASDLVKNWIFHAAGLAGLDSEAIHARYWAGFEANWWREDFRQGRLIRTRLDAYLNYWLNMRTAEEVQTAEVFPKFRRYADGIGSVPDVLDDLQEIADSFKTLYGPTDSSPLGTFLYRWSVMDVGVSTPVILWLLANRSELGEDAFEQALATIESYLVRRMICRLTTKDYNRLFLELVARITQAPVTSATEVIRDYLLGQTSESRAWPGDSQLLEALATLPLYQLLTRGRLRLILEALEDSLRSQKAEEDHVKRGLSIEHVMPQGWRLHWQPTILSAEEAARRDRTVHLIGNLTLVRDRLNSTMSNEPWAKKTKILEAHTVLHLNRRLLRDYADDWSEATVEERSKDLAQRIAAIWPRGREGVE